MTKVKMNIKQAAEKWVNEMDAIPLSLIEKAYGGEHFFDEVEFHSTEKECGNCGSTEVEENYCNYCEDEAEIADSYTLPMWGTVWSVNSWDEDWFLENLETVSNCGFFVYETDELGVFIGINGAGYDFYEAHWIPLYKARGLKWHDSE